MGTVNEIVLQIEGMHCGACIRRVTQALDRVPGIHVEEVRLGGARVKADDETAGTAEAVAALNRAGFRAHAG